MVPQIPKKLLIHSAELITRFEPDKWGSPVWEEAAMLNNVRIEYCSKNISDNTGMTISLPAVLFYDCKNSSPAVVFAVKGDVIGNRTVAAQQINFNGKTFTVQTVEALYTDSGNIHHYEIGLV